MYSQYRGSVTLQTTLSLCCFFCAGEQSTEKLVSVQVYPEPCSWWTAAVGNLALKYQIILWLKTLPCSHKEGRCFQSLGQLLHQSVPQFLCVFIRWGCFNKIPELEELKQKSLSHTSGSARSRSWWTWSVWEPASGCTWPSSLSPDLSDKGERELAHLLWAPLAEATNLIHKDPIDNPITFQRPYLILPH